MTASISLFGRKSRKDSAFNGETLYAALFTGTLDNYACTFSNGAADVTATGHNYVANMRIKFSTTGTLPTEVNNTDEYWITSAATNTFQVSATRGGTPISFTGSGTGTHTALEQSPIKTIGGKLVVVHPPTCLIRHEVANYFESPARKAMTFGAAIINWSTGVTSPTGQQAIFAPSSSITYRFVLE